MGVNVVAFWGLVANWDWGVVTAAAQAAGVARAVATGVSSWTVASDEDHGCRGGVAVAYWRLGDGAADQGEGDLSKKVVFIQGFLEHMS